MVPAICGVGAVREPPRQSWRRVRTAHHAFATYYVLVPKLNLGTQMYPKLGLGPIQCQAKLGEQWRPQAKLGARGQLPRLV